MTLTSHAPPWSVLRVPSWFCVCPSAYELVLSLSQSFSHTPLTPSPRSGDQLGWARP